jgi:hypothetical protein
VCTAVRSWGQTFDFIGYIVVVHEIKHDGYRIMARRDANGRVQLLMRKGNDFSRRFPRVMVALTALPVRSCLIDGEAIVCNENGFAAKHKGGGASRLGPRHNLLVDAISIVRRP